MSEKRVVEDKVSEVKEAKSLLMQYKVMGIANLNKVRAAQLQEIRRKMRGISCLRVFKNSTMKFALSESENKKNLKEVINHLSGSNIFLFTNLNPFKLKILLDKNKVLSTAKAGDIAPEDIVVPAGNTGMPPGPIISQLNAVGLPTRIESGSVWINKNTVVAKKGDVIDSRLASVLSKLGIKPIRLGLNLKAVYDDGLLLSGEDLEIDLARLKLEIEEAYKLAFTISFEATFPTKENISTLIRTAHLYAYKFSVNAVITTPETISEIIQKAYTQATYLSNSLLRKIEK